MKIEVPEEALSNLIAQNLLWNSENAEGSELRKVLQRAAFYYMTFNDVVAYLGDYQTAEEMFNEW